MGNNQSHIKVKKNVDVVMVGGGHSNVQVIKEISEKFELLDRIETEDIYEKLRCNSDINGVRLTLISDHDTSFYSGMLPGCIAKQYDNEDIQINLVEFCKWANCNFIRQKMVGLDPKNQLIICENDFKIHYDYLSIDIGSTTRGLDIPGVEEYTIPTRPIATLIEKIDKFEKELNFLENNNGKENEQKEKNERKNLKICVVGAGAAGIELSFAFRSRFSFQNLKNEIVLINGSKKPLMDNRGKSLTNNIEEKLKENNITFLSDLKVKSIQCKDNQQDDCNNINQNDDDNDKENYRYLSIQFENREENEDCDLILFATGAAPPSGKIYT
eukprot:TRINITY_DN7127_c0_g1_i1.p1 TRINITY_DN7127_c0_g1~~TRINITY_DN7127_c0_g1_i1.p1  ORF type:complete len:328 (+),score=100.50 TRINITY_DN7127_c0_g1_i1:73-1056(+)